jgi:hypothetical protein
MAKKAAAPQDDQEVQDAQKWISTITAYEREFKKWEGRVDKILKRYRDDTRTQTNGVAKFNILWSNIQTLVPATFSRLPKPDVSRRFRDNDPVGRVAAMLLERALEFEIEHYPDYRAAMKNSVMDRFLGGRGTSWVRYEAHIEQLPQEAEQPDPLQQQVDQAMPPQPEQDTGQISGDADMADIHEELTSESAPVDYVHWRDFGHTIARTWEEVLSVWRKVYMQREALIERFGEELGKQIPLDTRPDEQKKTPGVTSEEQYQAVIYEIWDKESGDAIWLSKSMGKILDRKPDPAKLEAFFPCPRPLFATLTTDSLVPVPDFTLYQDQANQLDELADKIDGLIHALKIRGVYDASQPELGRLFTEAGNNDLIPVKNWATFAEKQGLKGSIDLVEIQPIVEALTGSYAAVEQVKQQIYDIMGLADIIRGSSDPTETATAQKMKGAFGSMRLRNMQGDVVQYATELLQIKAQFMCLKFQPDTLIKISAAAQLSDADQQLILPAIQLLKTEPLRNFRIEVSSDSMVQLDEMQEKADRMEFLQSTGQFLEKALPVAQSTPQITPLLVEMLKFGVTAFKVGKQVEGMFDEVMDQLKQAAANPPPPQPDPEMVKVQAQAQADQAKTQMQAQIDQQKLQAQSQAEAQKMQLKAQLDQQVEQARQAFETQKLHLAAELDQHKATLAAQVDQANQEAQGRQEAQENAMEAHREQMKLEMEQQQKQREDEFNRWKVEMDNQTKIAVAEIAAKTSIQTASMSANAANPGDGTELDASGTQKPSSSLSVLVDAVNKALADNMNQNKESMSSMMDAFSKTHEKLTEQMQRPRKILRGPDGKVMGVQ